MKAKKNPKAKPTLKKEQEKKEEPKDKLNLKREIKEWGIGLIIAGIIPFVFSGFLDYYVGVIVLILGVIALVFRKRWNLALIGVFIILLGAINIISVLKMDIHYGFLILGIVQIVIGIEALNKYHNLR